MALTKISTDGVKDDAITKAKIPANQIETSEIASGAVTSTQIADNTIVDGDIADATITLAKLEHGNGSNDGKFLRANNGADPTFETVSTTPADGSITQAKLNFPVANRNLIINGAMNVAQRGTSSTSSGYQTVDRFNNNFGGTDEAITQAQVDVASGTTPYTLGFRKAFKLTNGNQTSGAGSADYVNIFTKLEAQDIANSGWNYVSSSSSITLSFWVKSSVAQTMYARLNANDASKAFSFAISVTTSWQKITKTISGDSSLVFNNDNGSGLEIYFIPFYGTDYTTSGHTNDAWIADSGSDQVTDMTSTWYTTNDATLEITGVQLEVGSVATDFEHRSFGQELTLCQRYYETSHSYGTAFGTNTSEGKFLQNGTTNGAGNQQVTIYFRTTKRANPTVTGHYDGTVGSWYGARSGAAAVTSVSFDLIGMNSFRAYNSIGANYAASEQIGHWQAVSEL